jgi:hypothetical protein
MGRQELFQRPLPMHHCVDFSLDLFRPEIFFIAGPSFDMAIRLGTGVRYHVEYLQRQVNQGQGDGAALD